MRREGGDARSCGEIEEVSPFPGDVVLEGVVYQQLATERIHTRKSHTMFIPSKMSEVEVGGETDPGVQSCPTVQLANEEVRPLLSLVIALSTQASPIQSIWTALTPRA